MNETTPPDAPAHSLHTIDWPERVGECNDNERTDKVRCWSTLSLVAMHILLTKCETVLSESLN